ncbi:transposase [Streptomyces formicae]
MFLAHVTSRGRALIDRRPYLPEQSWCADPERRRTTGTPDDVTFATKPRLAGDMIAAALDAGVTASWVAGDEVYGQAPTFAPVWKNGVSDTSWPWPARPRRRSTTAASLPARTPSRMACRRGPGTDLLIRRNRVIATAGPTRAGALEEPNWASGSPPRSATTR